MSSGVNFAEFEEYCKQHELPSFIDNLVREITLAKPDNLREWIAQHLTGGAQQGGVAVLNDSVLNKGTAFTTEEREKLGLTGLLPAKVETLEEQIARCDHQLKLIHKDDKLAQFVYLNNLRDTNETLFYRLVLNDPDTIMPLIYTPTVGEVCQKFDRIWTKPRGLHIGYSDKGRIRQVLDNWKGRVDIIVVTDGSRILGLGDLGLGGMGIPIGKLSLYIACAGFNPAHALPIVLDVGCKAEVRKGAPFYLGRDADRVEGDDYNSFVDEFLMAVKDKWPKCLLQFEDFCNPQAFDLLAAYRKKLRSFNDDIQGTGAVIAAGFINCVKVSGVSFADQKIVFLGAGSAGVGVAEAIMEIMVAAGLSKEEARSKFYLVDSKGLVTRNRTAPLEKHKEDWARDDITESLPDLEAVVRFVKPSTLIGLSTIGGAFTEEIIKYMAEHTKRPVIMPLSNPTSKAEITASDAYKWTNGTAIVASGSPFPAYEHEGKTIITGQGNNMYIFPGLGLGAWLGQVTEVTDTLVTTSAYALAELVTEEQTKTGCVYPPLSQIRNISAHVAVAVLKKAKEEGVLGITLPDDVEGFVKRAMWEASYSPQAHL